MNKISISSWFIFSFILIIGAYLRLLGIFTNSFAFTYDVGRDMLALAEIIKTHSIHLIGFTTGLQGVFYGPWWYIFLLPSFFISGGNPQVIDFFIALIGLLSVILAFFLGQKLGGKTLGLIFMALVSFSPAMIGVSNQIWNPNFIPFFILIFYLTLFIFSVSKKKYWLLPLIIGILLGFIFEGEIVFGSLFFLSSALGGLIFFRKKLNLYSVLFILLGFILILSPRIIFDFRHQFLMTKSLLGLLHSPIGQSYSFKTVFLNRVSLFWNTWIYTLAQNQILGGLLAVFTILVLLFRIKKESLEIKLLVNFSFTILIVFFLGLMLFKHDIYSHYLIGLPVIYIFILSIALYIFLKLSKIFFWLSFILILIIFWFTVSPVNQILAFKKPLWQGDSSVYRNQINVINYIYRKAHGRHFSFQVYTPPVIPYTYEYLFSWYGKKYFGYIPTSRSKLLFYIIETDYRFPFRRLAWLNLRKGDGHIIKTIILQGNIIVQERKR